MINRPRYYTLLFFTFLLPSPPLPEKSFNQCNIPNPKGTLLLLLKLLKLPQLAREAHQLSLDSSSPKSASNQEAAAAAAATTTRTAVTKMCRERKARRRKRPRQGICAGQSRRVSGSSPVRAQWENTNGLAWCVSAITSRRRWFICLKGYCWRRVSNILY